MTQDALKRNELVKFAESFGFMAYRENRNNHRHFYWFLPDSNALGDHEFSLHQHKDGSVDYRVKEIGQCGYSTNYVPKIRELLKKIEARVGAAPAQTTEGGK